MMSGSRGGAETRRLFGQWYGQMDDQEKAKAIMVLSINSDRNHGVLQLLPEDQDLHYLTITGRIEPRDDGINFSACDPIFIFDELRFFDPKETLKLVDAFQLKLRYGNRTDSDRPDVERNILEACIKMPKTNGGSFQGHILLRERMAPCSSLWPLEQATTWRSFTEWAVSAGEQGWIFRGQSDPGFSLAASLHRRNRYDIFRYLSGALTGTLIKIHACNPNFLKDAKGLNSLLQKLQEPSENEESRSKAIFDLLRENKSVTLRVTRLLRHFGFPTPILDWSRNYKVAAFFATQESRNSRSDDFVIYAYNHCELKKRLFDGKDPGHPNLLHPANLIRRINPLKDPLGRIEVREKPQQALYLWSGIHDLEGFIRWMEMEEAGKTKDRFLRRFRFSGEEREAVREKIKSNGISRFSLFGTFDSLIEDLNEELF